MSDPEHMMETWNAALEVQAAELRERVKYIEDKTGAKPLNLYAWRRENPGFEASLGLRVVAGTGMGALIGGITSAMMESKHIGMWTLASGAAGAVVCGMTDTVRQAPLSQYHDMTRYTAYLDEFEKAHGLTPPKTKTLLDVVPGFGG